MGHYKLVNGDKTIEISRADFEAALGDRDQLYRQLEIESWFAEVTTATIAWLEGLLRFSARLYPVPREHIQIQIECETMSRMGAVLIATHGLRSRINKNHDDCPCEAACTIAWTLRDSCAHRTTRLFSTTTTSDDLWLNGSQIKRMPRTGNRHALELRVKAEELLEQAAGKCERRNLQKAVEELFPSGDIDVIAAINCHIDCVNRSMAAHRSKVHDPVASRNELLARHGFTGKPMAYVQHGTEDKEWLGEPFDHMLDNRNRLRQEHDKAPIFDLMQFGRGEFRAGSLEEARDYTVALLAERGLSSWTTEQAAAALDLDSGYAGEALCNDAPPLFKDAVERLQQRAQEAADALQWPGFVLRVLPVRLRKYKP